MAEVTNIMMSILRDAWSALVSAFLIFVILAMMAQMLKTTSAVALGANLFVYEALAAIAGLLFIGAYALLGVPAIVRAAQASIPGSVGSGPIAQLGELSAALIGGIAAIRIIKATLLSAAYAAAGGSARFADTLLETGEAVFGMMVASVAVSVSAAFF